ncbi:MAG: hypothetical protein ACI94Y_000058 [Maribacter sp.]|jgi:hypothetical protein
MVKYIKVTLILIPILILFVPYYSSAQFLNYRINTGKSYATIPFSMHNDFIVIAIKLDGKIPLNFILDTGASSAIVIYKEYTDFIGTVYERRLFFRGADRTQLISALLTESISIELPEVTASEQHVLVLENNYIEFDKYSGTKIDGILGMDLFRRFIVKINYETKLIYLFEPKHHQYNTEKYEGITFVKEKDKMYLESKINVNNDKEYDVKWLVDSGAAITVMLHLQESDSTFIPKGAVPGNIGKGLGGYIMGHLGKMKKVSFGTYHFEHIIGNFHVLADSLYVPTTDSIKEGILGNKILRQFHLIFDYNNSMIFARPNRFFQNIGKKDLSGISLIAAGLNLNNFIIEEIYPNSPAALSGLKKGDVLKKINRRNTLLMNLQGIEGKFSRNNGKKIKLVVKRGSEKVKVELVLSEYL